MPLVVRGPVIEIIPPWTLCRPIYSDRVISQPSPKKVIAKN